MKAYDYGEMKAYDYGGTTSQHLKYANAVINKYTSMVLNLKRLLNDLKYIDTWIRAAANEYGRLFQSC